MHARLGIPLSSFVRIQLLGIEPVPVGLSTVWNLYLYPCTKVPRSEVVIPPSRAPRCRYIPSRMVRGRKSPHTSSRTALPRGVMCQMRCRVGVALGWLLANR